MFLILGLTGKVGGAVARHLLELGHPVRALVRDPAKEADWAQQGVELCTGDFANPAAVAAALDGVDGAFLMLPPFFAPQPGSPRPRRSWTASARRCAKSSLSAWSRYRPWDRSGAAAWV